MVKKFTLELFLRTIYSTIKRRIVCRTTYFLEENIESTKKINEDIVIEEECEIKEINEDHIIEKDLEVEVVETIKEEIIEEVVNVLNKVKLDVFNVQTTIILVGDTKTKFIDFIGLEKFDLIIESYLVNIVNCMKIKGQEVQVAQLMTFKFGNKTRKMKYSKYFFLLAWKISDFKNELDDEFVSSGAV